MWLKRKTSWMSAMVDPGKYGFEVTYEVFGTWRPYPTSSVVRGEHLRPKGAEGPVKQFVGCRPDGAPVTAHMGDEYRLLCSTFDVLQNSYMSLEAGMSALTSTLERVA